MSDIEMMKHHMLKGAEQEYFFMASMGGTALLFFDTADAIARAIIEIKNAQVAEAAAEAAAAVSPGTGVTEFVSDRASSSAGHNMRLAARQQLGLALEKSQYAIGTCITSRAAADSANGNFREAIDEDSTCKGVLAPAANQVDAAENMKEQAQENREIVSAAADQVMQPDTGPGRLPEAEAAFRGLGRSALEHAAKAGELISKVEAYVDSL